MHENLQRDFEPVFSYQLARPTTAGQDSGQA